MWAQLGGRSWLEVLGVAGVENGNGSSAPALSLEIRLILSHGTHGQFSLWERRLQAISSLMPRPQQPGPTSHSQWIYACVCAQWLQSCPTLCNSLDSSPPHSSVHGVLQARRLEWVAMPSARGSSQPRDQTHFSFDPALAGRFVTTNTTWEDPVKLYCSINRCLGMGCISVACVGFNLLM